jgi:hypothetical protein
MAVMNVVQFMRYLAYAAGIVLKLAGIFLVLTACILWARGRPNAEIIFIAGAACFLSGVLFKRASWLKKCFRCREKVDRDATRCRHCGLDLPATSAESLSEPFYK